MCGICGIWGNPDTELLSRMTNRLKHRGPDSEGTYEAKGGVLGHRRLSIMDPEGGDHPIFNESGELAVLANGEIYNFPELHSSLSRNHSFSTNSDTECLVHLYEEKGPEMVNHLDGMFAISISDGDELFLARDYLGIKPLYYSEDRAGRIFFSSEMKGFPETASEIMEFPPGHWFHSRKGLNRFYEVPVLKSVPADVEFYKQKIRETFEKAVTKRLMSDVPLGVFLSGGLDSSLIAAVACKYISPLHTFSVGFEGSEDLASARIVADYLGTFHHEYLITEKELFDELPGIIYNLESYDQDTVRSSIPCYFTSRLASDHVKVILTGEGADELFGGYDYYKEVTDPEVLQGELRRSVTSMHNINLQRVDRMTMAHSIEGRVPFLDEEMIRLAQMIPTNMKLYGNPPIEKWILRMSFQEDLPDEILWRKKEQFDHGSGTVSIIEAAIGNYISDRSVSLHRNRYSQVALRSPEECLYHKHFCKVLDNSSAIANTVGRWSQRPELN